MKNKPLSMRGQVIRLVRYKNVDHETCLVEILYQTSAKHLVNIFTTSINNWELLDKWMSDTEPCYITYEVEQWEMYSLSAVNFVRVNPKD